MTAQPSEVHKQAWDQLLKLLSGRSWRLPLEYWTSLIQLAEWHHVVPTLYRELIENPSRHEFTSDQLETLHQAVNAERKKLLLLTQLQKQALEQLEVRGIRALFFKGIVAGQWLYDTNLLRQCRDIDLIVHPDDHHRACQALYEIDCYRLIPGQRISARGMKRYCAAMKDFSLVHRPSNGLIELHWSLRPFSQAFHFDFDTAWEKRSNILIDNNPVPVFDDSTHIRYLAAHGCNSHWGRVCWLLDWLKISQKALDWGAILDDCANFREKSHLKNTFTLAQLQFDIDIPDVIQKLPEPRFSGYVISTQARNQLHGQYPGWLKRQLLQLACQQDLAGGTGYIFHMMKKALAADTLHPEIQS